MKQEQIIENLRAIVRTSDFAQEAYRLVEAWQSSEESFQAVEPILRFMEQNPTVDFGTPGPLVHFVEQYYKRGYEQKLIESISRRPTAHTVWMLNRLINGTRDQEQRRMLTETLKRAGNHPAADPPTKSAVTFFLECGSQ
jgi:hypothetical protein